MNTIPLWAVPLAVALALLGWVVLRRRPPRGGRAAPQRPAAAPAVSAPAVARPAAAEPGSVLAQRQAATEALRQARRRKAEEEARQAAERTAQSQAPLPAARTSGTAAPVAEPRAGSPARAQAAPAAAAEPQEPLLSPLSMEPHASRSPGPPPASLAPLRQPPPPAGPPTVLVVDDSRVVRVKTSRLFEQLGWRVLLAGDGQAALHCLDSDPPDLVITDVEMPDIDGFELTRRVRAHPRWARLPVIMITSSDDRHRAQAMAVGVDVLLGKPYPEQSLLDQARTLLGAGAIRGAAVLH